MSDSQADFARLLSGVVGDPTSIATKLLLAQMKPGLERSFRLCAIPHEFDREVFAVLAPGLDAATARQSFQELSRLSVVLPVPGGFMLHDETRRLLFREWLEGYSDQEFTAASRLLSDYFKQRSYGLTDEAGREIAAKRSVYHQIGANQQKGMDEFVSLFRRYRHRRQFHDCETLIRLVHEYDQILDATSTVQLNYQEAKLAADRLDWTQAEALFRNVVSNSAADDETIIKSYGRLGRVYADQRSWKQAEEVLGEGIQRAERSTSDKELPVLYAERGVVLRERGFLAEAQQVLERSVEIARQRNVQSLPDSLNSLGTLYRRMNRPQDAVTAYQSSLRQLTDLGQEFRKAQVLNNLGIVHGDLGSWELSRTFHEQSLEISRRAGDTLGQARALSNLLRVLRNLGREDEALDAGREAVKLFKQMRAWFDAGVTHRSAARLHRAEGTRNMAVAEYQSAIECFQRSGKETEEDGTEAELRAYDKNPGLPWYAIASIILFGLLVIGLIGMFIFLAIRREL